MGFVVLIVFSDRLRGSEFALFDLGVLCDLS
jgi:hypothetical protein